MSNNGFGEVSKATVIIQKEEVQKLIKQYKKLKKYMKSPLFKVKTMDGTEDVIKNLLDEYGDESI